MAKKHRTLSLSCFRSTSHSKSRSGGSWPLWVLAGVAVVLGLLVIRAFIRQDDWLQWRQALERQATGFSWPPWNADWPPLPASREPHADFSGPYAFAATHSRELRYIPCFCGCERQGHRSNADCYLRDVTPSGRPTWDVHSFTCTTCVHVTREVALMMNLGRSLRDIRREIEAHHHPTYGTGMPTLSVSVDATAQVLHHH